MDTARIRDWLEIVGIFGVIASLIFVGLQMKLDQEIALGATYQSRSEATVDSFLQRASIIESLKGELKARGRTPDDPVSDEVFDSIGEGEKPTWLEYRAARLTQAAEWFLWDNTHFQYEQGFLPESHWLRIRGVIKASLRDRPYARLTWNDGRGSRSEFKMAVDEIMAEVQAEQSQ